MIRKIFTWAFIIILALLSIWLFAYFYSKSKKNPTIFKTEKPFTTDITKKTVATGSITPKVEVQIKPQVSGVIDELYVEAGQPISKGQLIARIKLVQSLAESNNDQVTVNSASNQLETAKVNYNNAKVELARQKKLYDKKVISQQEYYRFKLDFNLQKEAVKVAERNLMLVNQRVLQNSGAISNTVYATADGLVLDVPVKKGASVVGRGNFNEGTTIATIADMNSLIFEGLIDEAEVGKVKEGMKIELTIGALEDKKFNAELNFIAPKGTEEEGAIKFQIRAKLLLKKGDRLRAGYSASGDIVLDRKKKVLAIKESMLQFDKGKDKKEKRDKPYVEVEVGDQKFEKRYVKTGISDGINIEVLSGVTKKDKIKLPLDKDDDNNKND